MEGSNNDDSRFQVPARPSSTPTRPMDLQIRPSAILPPIHQHSWNNPHMKALRLGAFIRKTRPFQLPSPSSLRRFTPVSSLPPDAVNSSPSNHFSDDAPHGGSDTYRHALKFQKPSVIKWQTHLANSVSLVGTIAFPLKRVATRDGSFGVYTKLSVQTSRNANRAFWINLKMWGQIAEVSWQHLKQNDYVYVSGELGCYTMTSPDGQLKTHHEVTAHELNYVAKQGQEPVQQFPEELKSGASYLEKQKERLHLWQIFFANPYEWWDNRKHKRHPLQPDFKHKDTGEALWLNSKDPPWVSKQLELLDSKMKEMGFDYIASRRRVSTWEFDE